MKKIILLLLLGNAVNLYSSTEDTIVKSCHALYTYNAVETLLPTFPYVYVGFKDKSTGDVTSWTWSLNDSIFSHDQNPVFAFLMNRILNCTSTNCIQLFNVCLTITTSDGCTSSYCSSVNPIVPPPLACEVKFNYYAVPPDSIPVADIYVPDSNNLVKFLGISPNNVIHWHWDFGDSTYSDLQNPIHAFKINPIWKYVNCLNKSTNCIINYRVCLTITTSDSCQTSYCDYVNPVINPVPQCNANFSYMVAKSNPPQYNFVNESTWDGGTVLWSFGDGTTSTEENPTHVFSTYNYPDSDSFPHPMYMMPAYRPVYTVCLTITSNSGCISTYCQDIYLQPSDNNLCDNFIKLTTTSILGSNNCSGSASAELIDESGNPVNSKHYLWSTGSTSSEIFNLCNNASYSVSLTNNNGCVTVGAFSISDYSIPQYIQYYNDSSNYTFQYVNYNPIYNYEWDFCDGSVAKGYYIPDKYLNIPNSCWVDVVVKDSIGNLVSNEKIYFDKSFTGLNTKHFENQMLLYPVPVADYLNIRLSKPDKSQVEILDMLGRIKLIQSNLSNENISINVGQLPKGTYICKVKTGSYILSAKFIK